MATYQLVYGDDVQVVRETYHDIDDVQREDGWLVLFALKVIGGGPHGVVWTHSDQVHAELAAFLS
jgi:hypothetical protein